MQPAPRHGRPRELLGRLGARTAPNGERQGLAAFRAVKRRHEDGKCFFVCSAKHRTPLSPEFVVLPN